jgi:glycosyltransferase involved in cell wall biosynthesis
MTTSKKTILVYETGMGRGGAKHSLLTWLEMMRASGEFDLRILLGMEGWVADRLREREFAFELVPMPTALGRVKHGSWANRGQTLMRILQMLGGILSAWGRTFGLRADAVLLTGGRDFIMIAPLVFRLRRHTATIPQSTDWGSIPVCRTMCGLAGYTFAISQAVADSIIAMGIKREKVEVLPLIYTKDRTGDATPRDVVRTELGLPLDAPVIGLTGVIREQKGQREAILAFQKVVEKLPDARLVIVGAPQADQPDAIAYDREIRELAVQLNLAERVLFTGWRDDVTRLLRGFDALLVPSLHTEGVPRVILEGFEAGLYVIGSDMEQFREIFTGAGSLQPVGDLEAWAAAMIEVLEDTGRLAEESRKARALWETRFSEASATPKLLARFRQLASER